MVNIRLSKLFDGLPSGNKTVLLAALGYSSFVGFLAYRAYSKEKAEEQQAFIDFYRHAGHYKHPWVKNPSPVPENVIKTDYPALVEKPRGNRFI
jgi:hypothetical protein